MREGQLVRLGVTGRSLYADSIYNPHGDTGRVVPDTRRDKDECSVAVRWDAPGNVNLNHYRPGDLDRVDESTVAWDTVMKNAPSDVDLLLCLEGWTEPMIGTGEHWGESVLWNVPALETGGGTTFTPRVPYAWARLPAAAPWPGSWSVVEVDAADMGRAVLHSSGHSEESAEETVRDLNDNDDDDLRVWISRREL